MAGYSNTPLTKKLGLKEGFKAYVHQPPISYFDLLSPLPEGVLFAKQLRGNLNFIHAFVKDCKSFQAIFLNQKNVYSLMAWFGFHGRRNLLRLKLIWMKISFVTSVLKMDS